MHTKEPREDPLVEMGYEIRDVDYPKLRIAVILFFGFTGLSAIIGGFIYQYRFNFFSINEKGNTALARRPMPPAIFPLLQDNVTSKTDIADLRQKETARMTSTGVNPDGSVHIPVAHAMDLIVQRGIPPTHLAVPAVSKGNTTGQMTIPGQGTPPPTASSQATGTGPASNSATGTSTTGMTGGGLTGH